MPLFHDRTIIMSHVLKTHKMSSAKYNDIEEDAVKTYKSECGVELKKCQIVLLNHSTEHSRMYKQALRRVYLPAPYPLASYPGLERVRSVGFAQWRDKLQFVEGGRLQERTGIYNIAENLNTYRCTECNATFETWRGLQCHSTSSHKCKVELNQFQPDELALEPRYHRCFICSIVFLCDKIFIRRHVTKVHKLSVAKYRGLLHKWNMSSGAEDNQVKIHKEKSIGRHCIFECPICFLEFGSWLELRSHRSSVHKINGSRLQCNSSAASFLAKKLTYLQCKL